MNPTFIDIEANGLRPTKIWCVCLWNEDGKHEFTERSDFLAFLREGTYHFVAHNGFGYDYPWLEQLWDVDWSGHTLDDTYVRSQLADPRRSGGHSLAAWGERLGFPKDDFSDFDSFSPEMLTYCHRDVAVTRRVWKQLEHELKDFSQQSIDLELETGRIIGQQSHRGWLLDQRKAAELLGEVTDRLMDCEDRVRERFVPIACKDKRVVPKYKKDGSLSVVGLKFLGDRWTDVAGEFTKIVWEEFNLGSRQQIGKRLIRAGWTPKEFTETGQPTINEDALEGVQGIPEAELIGEYLMLVKRRGDLIQWLEGIDENNRIHGHVASCGAVTRRMTHNSPNMANVTSKKKPYGLEMRQCWIAQPGFKIVGVDADQLELVCLAHYMNDPDYIKAVATGDKEKGTDVHTLNQRAVGLADRDSAKTFIYAFLYGAGDAKIGSIVGGGRREGRILKQRFLSAIPALSDLKERVERAGRRGRLRLLDGGWVKAEGNYMDLNRLLQGTGAIIMKEALITLDAQMKAHSIVGGFVGNIHDEIQAEIREDCVSEYGTLAAGSITTAGEILGLRCPVVGTAHTGNSWAETH